MLKKSVFAILLAVLIVLAIAGVGLVKMQKQRSEESSDLVGSLTEVLIIPTETPDRIHLTVPAGFTETTSKYCDKYYVKDDASIIITGEEQVIFGESLQDYSDKIIKQYEETADAFTMVHDETIKAAGTECRILEFTYAIIGNDVRQDMQCMTAVLIKDEYTYLITCKSKKDTFLAYRYAFRDMLNTLVIEKPAETTLPAEESLWGITT